MKHILRAILLASALIYPAAAQQGFQIGPAGISPLPQNITGIKSTLFLPQAYGSCPWDLSADNAPCVNAAIDAATALVGSPAWTQEQGDGTLAAITAPTVTADTTNGCLNVSVTAPNTDLTYWVLDLSGVETNYQ